MADVASAKNPTGDPSKNDLYEDQVPPYAPGDGTPAPDPAPAPDPEPAAPEPAPAEVPEA